MYQVSDVTVLEHGVAVRRFCKEMSHDAVLSISMYLYCPKDHDYEDGEPREKAQTEKRTVCASLIENGGTWRTVVTLFLSFFTELIASKFCGSDGLSPFFVFLLGA